VASRPAPSFQKPEAYPMETFAIVGALGALLFFAPLVTGARART
jgi:hypothetical protein